jgi:hypothetical protein
VVRSIDLSHRDITDDSSLLDDRAGEYDYANVCPSSPYLLAQRET